MAQKQQLNVKLDIIKDQDIIEFLEGQPRSWAVREALRRYMRAEGFTPSPGGRSNPVMSTVESNTVIKDNQIEPKSTADDDDPFAPLD